MSRRINIGLAVDDIDYHFTSQACKGAQLAAQKIDANLYVFPGHYIGDPDSAGPESKYEYQYNTVFDLITERNIDILFICTGLVCCRATEQEYRDFLEKYKDIPTILLFANDDNYRSVIFDNKSGIKKNINHLIEEHGARRIAFVSGPMTNVEARERLEAYKEVLEENGIPYDDSLVVYGDFSEKCVGVVDELLDKCGDTPEAIVFANDKMAVAGYNVLNKRGLRPGKDIFVTGFDNDLPSVVINPPLTTVEASSAELVYKAILNTPNYLKGEGEAVLPVETHFVQRSSCGCEETNPGNIWQKLQKLADSSDAEGFKEAVINYLFGIFKTDSELTETKQRIYEFFDACLEFIRSGGSHEAERKCNRSFTDIMATNIMQYTVTEKIFNVLQVMQRYGAVKLGKGRTETMTDMFSEYYRKMSFKGLCALSEHSNKAEFLTYLVLNQSDGIMLMDKDSEISYAFMLQGLYDAGFSKSMLYLFQGSTVNKPDSKWRCPNTILIKAISDINGVRDISTEEQLLRTEKIFENEFIDEEARSTMVVSPLFVGEDLYGLFVCEPSMDNLANISIIAHQLSLTIKSLMMKEAQNKVAQDLQASIEKYMRDNSILDNMAKTDELTKLLNRRGFTSDVQKLISDETNLGKHAVICYADMDNLKMVNDKFGHDEGDFAIKTIADVLRESFRASDVVGRMGGDEFVVFTIPGDTMHVEDFKKRIETICAKHNAAAGKPYPIEVSTGFCEFTCGPDEDIFEKLDIADSHLYEEKTEKKKKNGSYR